MKVVASAGGCEAAAESGEVSLGLAKAAVVGCTTAAEVRRSDAGLSTICNDMWFVWLIRLIYV